MPNPILRCKTRPEPLAGCSTATFSSAFIFQADEAQILSSIKRIILAEEYDRYDSMLRGTERERIWLVTTSPEQAGSILEHIDSVVTRTKQGVRLGNASQGMPTPDMLWNLAEDWFICSGDQVCSVLMHVIEAQRMGKAQVAMERGLMEAAADVSKKMEELRASVKVYMDIVETLRGKLTADLKV